jgi:hypothetical protein
MGEATTRDHEALKSCRAALYGSDWARLLLGDAFHPGGLALTERLGTLLDLGPGVRLLDVAAGRGVEGRVRHRQPVLSGSPAAAATRGDDRRMLGRAFYPRRHPAPRNGAGDAPTATRG